MVQHRQAQKLNAIAFPPVFACLVAFGWPVDLQAAGDDELTTKPAVDLVLQPGIVEQIPPPWRDRWQLFDWLDAPSKFRAAASFSAVWNDNVLLSETAPVEDFVWDTNLAIWFESSEPSELQRNYLKFGYDPQILTYTDLAELDAVNHRWFARYFYRGSRLNARIDHRDADYSDASLSGDRGFTPASALEADTVSEGDPDTTQQDLNDTARDLGRLVQGTRQSTSAFAAIDMSNTTLFRPSASRRFQDIELGDGETGEFEEWWIEGIAYREFSRRLRLGLGPRFGWADFSRVNSQNYWQGLAHLRFRYSPKLQVDGSVGVDYRQYGARAGHQTTPLFLTRLTWSPSKHTALSFEGFQRARATFGGDVSTDLGTRLALNQNLFHGLNYSLRLGYISSEFASGSATAAEVQRDSDFIFVRNALEYRLSERGLFTIFHELRDNSSNRGLDYTQALAGVSLGFEF